MRFLISTAAGVVTSFLLFLMMHGLISGAEKVTARADDARLVDFIRLRPDELVNTKQRKKPKPPDKPKEPPPPPKLNVVKQDKPPPQNLDIETPNISTAISTGSGPYLGGWSAGDPTAEGDVIPIVRIQPNYPRDALLNGISGWVKVRFTIEADGSVSSPSVIESEPRRIFNRDAIRAILRWKFKPRVVEGVAVARDAEQIIEFNLDQS